MAVSHHRLIPIVREGRSPSGRAPLGALIADLELPLRTVAIALAIPERTMHRLKSSTVVPAVIADKVARSRDVLQRATAVLGSRPAARHWLARPNPALAGATPLSRLDTSLGWEQVKQLLGRIEHGIPA